MARYESTERGLLLLSAADNVAVTRVALAAGSTHRVGTAVIVIRSDVAAGFKIALREIASGEKILKYGAPIGSATRAIQPGDIVHLENMKSDYIATHARGGAAPAGGDAG
jgi:hypothetical protein